MSTSVLSFHFQNNVAVVLVLTVELIQSPNATTCINGKFVNIIDNRVNNVAILSRISIYCLDLGKKTVLICIYVNELMYVQSTLIKPSSKKDFNMIYLHNFGSNWRIFCHFGYIHVLLKNWTVQVGTRHCNKNLCSAAEDPVGH